MGRPSIAVIGAGNVATHLAKALDESADVVQVLSRDINHARDLTSTLRDAQAIDTTEDLRTDADFYLISVSDDSIAEIAKSMPKVEGIVMHTSGSVGIDALDGASHRTGVFYPLQTFSKRSKVDVSKVPFFLEASDAETLKDIELLAETISKNIYHADSKQRTILHIAAVFGCNFFNHLLGISEDILKSEGYTLDVLKPLLEVTLDKALSIGPHNAQTGPAARKDMGVINKHLKMLDPENAKIYKTLSQSIAQQ